MGIEALQKRLGEIRSEAEAIVQEADANTENPGHMDESQTERFDALMSEKEKVEGQIDRLEKLEGMSAGTGRKTPADKPAKADADPAGRVTHQRDRVEDDPMRGFNDMGDFASSVKSACMPGGDYDDRLKVLGAPTNFHRETSSTDGYMVPPAIRESVWQLVFDDEGILSSVNPEPTESNSVQLTADESTPWGSTGVQANWASEGQQFSPSRLTTEARHVQLHKLYAYVLATEELIEDAARLNNRLTTQSPQAIRFRADEAIVEGNGVGKPLGWMNSGALVTVPKESGQSADTITAQNVTKMYSRLLRTQGAFWNVHQSTLPQLQTMTIGNQPIWTPPSTGLRNAPGGMLLGLPIRFSEHASSLGDKGDVQLVSPQGYYASVKSGGIKFAASMHLYFDYDVEAFRWTFRLGGQPFLTAPVEPNKGNQTRSHFITLAERT